VGRVLAIRFPRDHGNECLAPSLDWYSAWDRSFPTPSDTPQASTDRPDTTFTTGKPFRNKAGL
jgi:hypothetical protein